MTIALPALGDIEHLHRRLQNVEFITAEADRNAFAVGAAECERLRRADDRFRVPVVEEAGAWSKMYSLRKWLLKREQPSPEAIARREREAAARAIDERRRTQFLARWERLRDMRQKGSVDDATCWYFSLQPIDYENPWIIREKYGQHLRADWEASDDRINRFLSQWESMNADRKAMLEHLVALAVQNVKLERRIEKLEQQFNQKEKANA